MELEKESTDYGGDATAIVKNLPLDVTSERLTELFTEEFGTAAPSFKIALTKQAMGGTSFGGGGFDAPATAAASTGAAGFQDTGVRRAFVVNGKGANKQESRGFGFVVFTSEKLLESAVKRFSGKEIDGRAIVVEKAVRPGDKLPSKPKDKDDEKAKKTKRKRGGESKEAAKQLKNKKRKVESNADADADADADSDDEKSAEKTKLKQKKAVPITESSVALLTGIPKRVDFASLTRCSRALARIEHIVFPAPESTEDLRAARITFSTPAGARKAKRKLAPQIRKSFPHATHLQVTLMNATARLSRLIVRNLAFTVTEERLRATFEEYGDIKDVTFPLDHAQKRPRGFAFVEFETVEAAAKAIDGLNMQRLNGRAIAVDWAMAKKHFDLKVERAQPKPAKEDKKKKKGKDATVKSEPSDDDEESDDGEDGESKVKKEEASDDEDDGEESDTVVKQEEASGDDADDMFDDDIAIKKEEMSDSEGEGDASEENEDADDNDMSDSERENSDDEDAASSSAPAVTAAPAKPKRISTDADEGLTIFIRNLPFDTKQIEVHELFKQFGQIEYTRVTMNKITGQSRGTAFVKFKKRASTQKALQRSFVDESKLGRQRSRGLELGGRVLNVCLAVSKPKVVTLSEKSRERKADKRNLYLAREGLISDPTSVSEAENERRSRAWRAKKKKLENPNFSVSRVRLSVMNLPIDCSESALKKAFLAAARKARKLEKGEHDEDHEPLSYTFHEPVVKQVKIVRDTKRVGKDGKPRSHRFGFIEFREHEDALSALRATNNNPRVFDRSTRLQVEFALEDARKLHIRDQHRQHLKAKQERIKAEREVDARQRGGRQSEGSAEANAKASKRKSRKSRSVSKNDASAQNSKASQPQTKATKKLNATKKRKNATNSQQKKSVTQSAPQVPREGLSKKDKRKLRKKERQQARKQKRQEKQANAKQGTPQASKPGPKPSSGGEKPVAAARKKSKGAGQRVSKRLRREIQAEKPFDDMVAAYKRRMFGADAA